MLFIDAKAFFMRFYVLSINFVSMFLSKVAFKSNLFIMDAVKFMICHNTAVLKVFQSFSGLYM